MITLMKQVFPKLLIPRNPKNKNFELRVHQPSMCSFRKTELECSTKVASSEGLGDQEALGKATVDEN
jgi:hypothetical protein